MTDVEKLDFEPVAKQVFEQFIVLKPLVPVEGLYRHANAYYIVVPSISNSTSESQDLIDWFTGHLRPAAQPIYLTSARPPDAVEVMARQTSDIAVGHGVVRTWSDLSRDIALALPGDFPRLRLISADRTAVVRVERALLPEEAATLSAAFEKIGAIVPHRVEVVSAAEMAGSSPTPSVPKRGSSHNLALIPGRWLPAGISTGVQHLINEDDDFWRTIGVRHLAGHSTPAAKPQSWDLRRSCLVSTVFPPSNLRTYLTLYSTVVLVAPLAGKLQDTLQALGVNPEALLELTRRGRVRWLFPQAVDRYDLAWLSALAEAVPEGLMMSRRLAVLAAQDQRARNPLYQLAASAYDRRAVLRALHRFADDRETYKGTWVRLTGSRLPRHKFEALFARTLAHALSAHWASAEYTLQTRGAMASMSGPLARHATEIGKVLFGKNLFIELGSAAQTIEWAGALGAHAIPEEAEGYSAAPATQFLVALSSGSSRRSILTRSPRELQLAQEILAFDNDTNVVDFATDMGRGDLFRIGKVIEELASGNVQDVPSKIRAWNAEVRRYERRPDRLKTFNIAAILLTGASWLLPYKAVRDVVPPLTLLMPSFLTLLQEELVRRSTVGGRLADWLNGVLSGTRSDPVLISRMRKRIGTMKDTKSRGEMQDPYLAHEGGPTIRIRADPLPRYRRRALHRGRIAAPSPPTCVPRSS